MANRLSFYERAEHELACSRRSGTRLTIVVIDCDGFKAVNDTYGHAAGDRVLRAVGEGLKGAVRQSDIAARIGGDEFVLLLSMQAEDTAQLLVGRVTDALHAAMQVGGWAVTFSIGAVTFHAAPESVEALLARADALMYTIKDRGKDGVAYSELGISQENARA